MVVLLECLLQVMERLHPVALVLADPALVNLIDRHGIEVMQLFTPPPHRGNEVGPFEHSEVLGHGLPRHVQMFAELAQRLPVGLVQPVQKLPAGGIGESFEHFVHI
jgi:hypothetical protein